ncbi:RrF2 family transcriptional regulator [Deinococcus ficus]|uniref:RrF2 family transcriptional regulator n=1 Tax=Deinococcus ficus TaxID=317577 RepID=UPI0003B584D7|nr:Rrf2 family transcriptional regulator [Deinococcus ficus]
MTAPHAAGPSVLPHDPWRSLLKREESYAIHALLNIAQNPGTNAATIAEQLQISYTFLTKVLRRLTEMNYVASAKGRGGGVTLKVDPAQVSLLDIIEAISGPVILDPCQTKPRCATQQRTGKCNLKRAWLSASLGIREILGGITLAQLCDPQASTPQHS